VNDLSAATNRSTVPYPVTDPDRIPSKRYYDQGFYDLEVRNFWPRAWQMACRLEEIPEQGDYSVYRNVGMSAIVIRTGPDTIKAYDNACRHRGVELVNSRGKAKGGFVCPFHGWRWNAEGKCTHVYAPEAFAKDQLDDSDLRLTELKVEVWGGCVFVNWDKDAPGYRETLGLAGETLDRFHIEDLRAEWWLSAKVPCNWKVALEAFMEGYHVATTHTTLRPMGVTNHPDSARWMKMPDDMRFGSRWFTVGPDAPAEVSADEAIEQMIYFMEQLNLGMAGMVAAEEVEVIKGMLGTTELPRETVAATKVLRSMVNQAVATWYTERGMRVGDFEEIDRAGTATYVNYCFPHFYVLPVYGAASSYRIRPLGPEECLFEIWSLKRYPKGQEPPLPPIPEPIAHSDPSWPLVPREDFRNLPRQQVGLRNPGFEFMRLSEQMEGLISNYHRTLDRYLAGEPNDRIAAALLRASGPIESPCAEM